MKIEIFGDGCSKCKVLKKKVQQAVAELGIQAEVNPVIDPERIADLQVMSLPQLMVDGEMAGAGNLASVDDIKAFLRAGARGDQR